MISELKSQARRLITEYFINTPETHVVTALADKSLEDMCKYGNDLEMSVDAVVTEFQAVPMKPQRNHSRVFKALELLATQPETCRLSWA